MTTFTNIHGIKFFDPDRDIENGVRTKKRCRYYVWQFKTKTDIDGIIYGACIAVDRAELDFCKEHGVHTYRFQYGDTIYTCPIENFYTYGVDFFSGREGDGKQVAMSIRHFEEIEKKGKKRQKKQKKQEAVENVTPAPQYTQPSFFK